MNVLALFAFLMAIAALAACIPIAAVRTVARKDLHDTPMHLQEPPYGTARSCANVAWLDDYRRARGLYLRRKGRTLLANVPFIQAPYLLRNAAVKRGGE